MKKQFTLELRYNPHRIFKLVKDYINGDSLSDLEIEMLVHAAIRIQIYPAELLGMTGHKYPDFQNAASTLERLIYSDRLDYDLTNRKIISRIILPPELREEIARQHYPLPMVTPPKPVTHNKDSGYLSIKMPLLLGSRVCRHNYPLAYDVINKLNATPLTIRKDYINPALINPSDGNHHRQLSELAGLLPDSPVYLTHAYDKRGRIYCRGYHFNYQGDSYHKSLIEIAKPERINS